MQDLYCTPFDSVQQTEWKSLEEAFKSCDSLANCTGFMRACNGKFGICSSFKNTRSSPCSAIYIKKSKFCLNR